MRERKRLLARQMQLEGLIGEEEMQLSALEEELSSPYLFADGEKGRAVLDAHRLCQDRLRDLYSQWEEVTRASEQAYR